MRKTALIQISLALVLALAAGVVIFKWMDARMNQTAQAKPESRVMLMVAAKDLKRGARLTAEALRAAPFLAESAPSGAFKDTEELVGRVLGTDLGAGEPVTLSRLLDDGAPYAGVSAMISPGKRAVAVKGNKVLGLSGFIRPGNHVDVLVTIDVRKQDKDVAVTKTVLEDVRVIATGTELEVQGDDGATSSVDTYTLELSTHESEKLALAATRGTLHFALRNPADSAVVATEGVDVARLLASLNVPQRGTGKVAAPRRTSVEIITGTSRKTVRFRHADAR
ncbi:Flp pilus assembly protein CpaB [Desulfocurvus sp. DL9XJH121]